MPLPLIPIILGAIGGASAIGGIASGIKGAVDTNDAKDVNRRANWLVDDAKNLLDASRKSSNTALEALGSKKLYILDKSVMRFVNDFEKLQNVELGDSSGLNELNKFRLDKQSFGGLKKMGDYAASVVGGAAGGALGGALAGFGAWSAAAAFGSASTGTAIAGLGGVAATNATLAFLGGGSLAAGGLGMAGGMAVLGGLVAGPALLIMGGIFGAAASAELDKARGNFAQAKKTAEELNAASELCNGIRKRSYMFERLLIGLQILFDPLVFNIETIIASRGVDWVSFKQEEKNTVAAAASIAKAIKTVLDTPILTEDGKLTEESLKIATEVKAVVDKREKA